MREESVGRSGGGDDVLEIGGEQIGSRLIAGTGKFRSEADMEGALLASGAEMVTLAVKRLDMDAPEGGRFMEILERGGYRLLPNTAGCATAEEAVFAAKLAREMLGTNWIKLEVIPDGRYLLPDAVETLRAAETLVADGFVVLPYIGADPVAARRLEEAGCATVMPLGSPIGSGRGLLTADELEIIVEGAGVPVVVDAGIGVPSEAAQAMELGADAVLVNSAIAGARDPALMAGAFREGVRAGRAARLAGRIERRRRALASSPVADAPRPPRRGPA